jgi:hypothetical protein
MSSFSQVQCHNLVNNFWNRARTRCPYDGAAIVSHFYSAAEGYLLVLACNHCGKKVQITRFSDPNFASFRRWTDAEAEALASACGRNGAARCPVCLTPIHYRELAGAIRFLECPRCGNMHETCTLNLPALLLS